ncbi:hypothetical protein NG796_07100 [Laspinema sp. A4]|uniref:hypothetical protein n=1 Tax=Laspinema sp. D2d TaxID=2953686 RepID=UPI0021BA7C55|nr:hypothetical protein [Laspinema sp. D2d]MCT7983057.1 hypothetical protein [Laspinema sp. D2d]
MGESKRRQKLDPNFGKGPSDSKNNQEIELKIKPDYTRLVEIFLNQGSPALIEAIFAWLGETGQIHAGEKAQTLLNCVNKITQTVYELASKNSKTLASMDFKMAGFTLKVPFETDDFESYLPVVKNKDLAREAMCLINTGFFDIAITYLINKYGDAVGTLRKYGVVLYMGTNSSLEIIDAACALAAWKPFEVVTYAGEERNSLNGLIEKTFRPLTEEIQRFRINTKGADRFPCLSLLCLIENKTTGSISEFRKHYTAQSGGQLIIPGFSPGSGSFKGFSSMKILGTPRNVPSIRGFNSKED